MLLYADELDDKVRELQRLQSELESAEAKARETAELKKDTETKIQRTDSLRRITDQNLSRYRRAERTVRDSLIKVERQIQLAKSRLEQLHSVQEDQLELLIKIDRSYRYLDQKHRDQRYLCALINQSQDRINHLMGYSDNLIRAQHIKSSEASRINKDLKAEDKKRRRYSTEIRNLTSQSQKLSQEEQALQARIARMRQDATQLQNLINRLMEESGKQPSSYQFTQIKIAWPVRGEVIRNFGQETRSYNTSVVSNGIDIAVREGSNVVAVDDGEVIFADRYGAQGKMIIIDHQNGYYSLYGYNSDLLVSRGSKVTRGQIIARSGMTGSANVPSLHFELRKDGAAINPLPFFED
nr:hypothetical protein [Candidatus Cloacimonadota bacterium]